MNTLDIIISVIVLIPALMGFKKGLLRGLLSIGGIIAGLILATKYNTALSSVFSFVKTDPAILNLFSFVTIVIVCYMISVYIAEKISGISTATKGLDRILGVGLGFLKGLIIASLFLIISTNVFSFFDKSSVDKSKLYPVVINIAPQVYDFIIQFFPNANDFYEELKVKHET